MAKVLLQVLLVLLAPLLLATVIEGRRNAPLLDEDNMRTRNKNAECIFGKETRELGSSWIPDLGVPIGVLYCMKCECVAVQRKRRIVARVHCRNIQKECPEPTCDEPIQKPGACCKYCPGDAYDPNIVQDVIPKNVNEDEDKSAKHYAALLTGRSSLVLKNDAKPNTPDMNKNNVVATGRFTFHKKNLHYSFYISEKAARPRLLQFADNDGRILEEFTLSYEGGLVNSVYQNATRKVCGVWKRLPRDYRQMLKQEKLYVILIWGVKEQAEFTLSGQLKKYVALGTEMFSSLLEPAPGTNSLMAGSGGTAIVSISTSLSPTIHIAIIFNGLFTPRETYETPINVTLSYDERKEIILQEIVKVHKPASDLNLIEIKASVTPQNLRHLTRGRLLLSLHSTSKPEALKLNGNIITKTTCELFQATLTPNPSEHIGTSGIAWMYLNNAGSLVFNIEVENLKHMKITPTITLVDVSTKRRTEIEDLTPFIKDGWVNGTLDKLSPKILVPLYDGKLLVNVDTTKESSLIKGRLIAKPVDDARDAPTPILLKRDNTTQPIAGMAWISVDNDCHIHYDVSISGLNEFKNLQLYMEMYPMIAPGAPCLTKELANFTENQVEGSPVEVLTKEELNRLDSGVSFLKVKDRDSRNVLLTAIVTKVKVPPSCRSPLTDNDVPTLYDNPETSSTGACFFEEKFYGEESSWVSAKNPCKMCFCQNGVAKCDVMSCPELNCQNGTKLVRGECCPVCKENEDRENNLQKCFFSGRAYFPGSVFNPFLIPNGFDKCTECICDPNTLEIKCYKLEENEKSCCRNCNKSFNANSAFNEDHVPLIPTRAPPKEDYVSRVNKVLEEGGCRNTADPRKPHLNGSEYHPVINSLGEYKCVTCKCLDGKQTCRRQHCDQATCKKLFEMKRKKMSFVASDYCCSLKDCRKIRHRKNRPSSSINTS